MSKRLFFAVPVLLLVLACQQAPSAQASSAQDSQSAPVEWKDLPPAPPAQPPEPEGLQTAVFAGGCFWGVQAVFERLRGVENTVAGYSGGSVDNPSYEMVTDGQTGHAESVEVLYDSRVISYGTLLQVFFAVVLDPTQLNYQGPDHGTQYRSALFYKNPTQEATARAYIATLDAAKIWPAPIVTEITAFSGFWAAEEYHQHFLDKNPANPYIAYWDMPKIKALETAFPKLLTASAAADSSAPASPPPSGPTLRSWHGLAVHAADERLYFPITKSDADWFRQLGSQAYAVLREQDTEAPFSGPLNDEHRQGIYYSAATGQPLFRSEDKFDSGTGWPSFTRPIDQDAVVLRFDDSFGMERIEVADSSSGSHLGHVFDDGPAPTGLRYCMNSAALVFVPDGDIAPDLVKNYRSRK